MTAPSDSSQLLETALEHHAETLLGRAWRQRAPDWQDLVAVAVFLTMVILLGSAARQMLSPLAAGQLPEI